MELEKKMKGRLKQAGQRLTGQTAALVPQLRVELLQNRQAVVEGCRGVLEYSDSCIRLSADRIIVRFVGSGLQLRTFGSGSAIVEGVITGVDYM